MLLNCPSKSVNPGTVIHRNDTKNNNIFMVLTGTVQYISAKSSLQTSINTGDLIGNPGRSDYTEKDGIFRSASYVETLEFSVEMYDFIISSL
jgi:hypothetical protein